MGKSRTGELRRFVRATGRQMEVRLHSRDDGWTGGGGINHKWMRWLTSTWEGSVLGGTSFPALS
jgi:hypothetical protein